MTDRPIPQLQNYDIQKTIGVGGMGIVYLAEDRVGQQLAIKVIHPELANDSSLRQRFEIEGRTLAALGQHENIVFLYGLFEENDTLFIVMEYIEGDGVDQRIKTKGLMPADEALPVFWQTLKAIGYAHQHGVVHRDIKPSNILVRPSGIVQVMDFGIARVRGGPKLTTMGMPGTPEYMSPELFAENTAGANELSDIYALGVLLYEMMTAKVPFDSSAETTVAAYIAIAKRHQETDPPLPSSIYPPIDTGVEKTILRALAKRPEMRYQSVAELREAIELHMVRLGIAIPNQDSDHAKDRSIPLPVSDSVSPPQLEPKPEPKPVLASESEGMPVWAAVILWLVLGGMAYLVGNQFLG